MAGKLDQKLTISEQEDQLWATSMKQIQHFLDDTDVEPDKARVAAKAMDILTKREGSRVHRDAVKLSMLEMIFHNNPDALSKAVGSLQPDLKKLSA